MSDTVGSHSVAAFTSPSNGDALDANVVKGNDNTVRTAFVAHDADPGIHLQSSTLASRPAAGTAGRKWLTTDSGNVRLWYDTGSVWEEADYTDGSALNASNLTSGTVPDGRFPATLPAVSGANLTNLNASNLGSGTIPDARFPAALPAVSGANLTNLPVGAAGTLTGTTLASNVVNSSLTGVGTLTSLTVSGTSTLAAVNMADNTLTRPVIKDYGETRTTPSISSGTLTLNLENGNVFGVSLNANITTLTIQNPSASGTACSFTLAFTADGTLRTVTWGASVKWPGGVGPTLTSTNGKVDIFTFVTWDAGTTWYGFIAGQNF